MTEDSSSGEIFKRCETIVETSFEEDSAVDEDSVVDEADRLIAEGTEEAEEAEETEEYENETIMDKFKILCLNIYDIIVTIYHRVTSYFQRSNSYSYTRLPTNMPMI
jgi:hypothetical protein